MLGAKKIVTEKWMAAPKVVTKKSTSSCSWHTLVWELWRWMAMLRVVLREPKVLAHNGQILVWGLWRQTACRELCQARKGVLIYNKRLCRWLSPRQLQHIVDRLQSEGYEDRQQRQESCWSKMSPKCMMHGYTSRHHWDKWLACSRQTSVCGLCRQTDARPRVIARSRGWAQEENAWHRLNGSQS